MELKPELVMAECNWTKQFTMTDVIVSLCDQEGFNTVFDDDDSVIMQNDRFTICLTTDENNLVHGTYYWR